MDIRKELLRKYANKVEEVDAYVAWSSIERHYAKGVRTYRHHILPKETFPEFAHFSDHPWNLAFLNYTDHTEATRLQSKIDSIFIKGYLMLRGQTEAEMLEGAARGTATMRRKRIGVFDPKVTVKALKAARHPKARARASATMRRTQKAGLYDPKIRALASTPKVRAKARATMKRKGVGIFNAAAQEKKFAKMRSPEAQRRAVATHRKNGTGVFDPRVRAKGLHVRDHVNKGRIVPTCSFCIGV